MRRGRPDVFDRVPLFDGGKGVEPGAPERITGSPEHREGRGDREIRRRGAQTEIGPCRGHMPEWRVPAYTSGGVQTKRQRALLETVLRLSWIAARLPGPVRRARWPLT